jgi:hypothetical protein
MIGLSSSKPTHPFFAVFGADETSVHHGLRSETILEMEAYCKKYLPAGESVKIYKSGEYVDGDGDTLVSEFVS